MPENSEGADYQGTKEGKRFDMTADAQRIDKKEDVASDKYLYKNLYALNHYSFIIIHNYKNATWYS